MNKRLSAEQRLAGLSFEKRRIVGISGHVKKDRYHGCRVARGDLEHAPLRGRRFMDQYSLLALIHPSVIHPRAVIHPGDFDTGAARRNLP